MLKSKQYAKWGKGNEDPDWGNLKATEDERRASLRDTKVRSMFQGVLSIFSHFVCFLSDFFECFCFENLCLFWNGSFFSNSFEKIFAPGLACRFRVFFTYFTLPFSLYPLFLTIDSFGAPTNPFKSFLSPLGLTPPPTTSHFVCVCVCATNQLNSNE